MTPEQFQFALQKVYALEGQLAATQIAVRTLLLTHPDREAAIQATSQELDRWATAYLYSQATEATVEGFANARKKLFPSGADLERYP